MSEAMLIDRWARALMELGQEQGQLKPLVEQIRRYADAYAKSPELSAVLDNPLVPEAQRGEVLSAVATRLGLGQLAVNAVKLLARRRRLWILPELSRRLAALTDESSGVVRATVVSAVPLDEAYCQRLQRELERVSGRKVLLEKLHDPTLLGGVVTRLGDRTIDGSLRGRLQRLEQRLARA